CAKQAHWNVRGPNFQGLHELFDLIAAETRRWSDLLAERAVTLGGTAHGTVQDVASGSKLSPFPTDERNWEALCKQMHSRMLAAAESFRTLASSLDDELATQDLCIEIMRGLEMRAWMVDAHLGMNSR
ncbi:MAG: Dps family protein, partial [Hyphomicrobiales bacterium]